jgi:NAD+ kinase
MHLSFKRVILFARAHRATQEVIESFEAVVTFCRTHHIEVYLESETSRVFEYRLPVLEPDDINHKTDIIVVVGGDGSLLSAAALAVDSNIPVVGVNRGQLGFLTDIAPSQVETHLIAVLKGQYIEEHRFFLDISIQDADGKEYFQGSALNDMVLTRGNAAYLLEFDVYINQELVSYYRADGLIVATPTGSTAYALSAGGPIMHPHLQAFLLVPMCAHRLSSRPLVVDSGVTMEVHISPSNADTLAVSCDGHAFQSVKPGDRIVIQKKTQTLRLLHPKDYHYYNT